MFGELPCSGNSMPNEMLCSANCSIQQIAVAPCCLDFACLIWNFSDNPLLFHNCLLFNAYPPEEY